MKLTLAYCPVACSLVPYILLTEAGATFDTLDVNLGNDENLSPDYLKINPKAKVPALIIDGEVLTENLAIQVWIAHRFPQARLMPTEPLAHARALAVMAWCAAGIHPKLTQQARPARYCDLPHSADNVREHGAHSMMELFAIAETMLEGREWFFDHFTCADAYFYWCFRRGTALKSDASGFTNCMAHLRRMEQRASVQALLTHEQRVMKVFSKAN
jgi:glutathione S-transferase